MRRVFGSAVRATAHPVLISNSFRVRSFWNQPPPSKKDSFPSPPPMPKQKAAAPRVFGVNEGNFDKEVIQSSVPVVLLVASEQTAQSVASVISEGANNHPGLKFCFLNSSVDSALAQELGVSKVPTIMAVFQGKLLEQPMVGVPTPAAATDFFRRVGDAAKTLGQQTQKMEAMQDLLVKGELHLDAGELNQAAQVLIFCCCLLFLIKLFPSALNKLSRLVGLMLLLLLGLP